MKRMVFVVAAVSVALGVGYAIVVGGDADTSPGAESATKAGLAVAQSTALMPRLPEEGSFEVKAGTRKEVGVFSIGRGRALRLRTVETLNGYSCLVNIEEPSGGSGSQCMKGGLFSGRSVVFSINFDGGPARFSSMYLVGIAAPAIGAVSVARTDGSTVDARLSPERAFVVGSSAAELEQDVFPSAVLAYGRSGKLVETSEIPVPR